MLNILNLLEFLMSTPIFPAEQLDMKPANPSVSMPVVQVQQLQQLGEPAQRVQ
jgi:hypothetical protein